MQYIPTQKKLPQEQRRLLELFSSLAPQDQTSLMAFAEFLASRDSSTVAEEVDNNLLEPKPIPRPSNESVVKAIKRLSASYHMLERDKMLDETSTLMTAHIIHGRDAASVIDDIEALFERHYQIYLKQN